MDNYGYVNDEEQQEEKKEEEEKVEEEKEEGEVVEEKHDESENDDVIYDDDDSMDDDEGYKEEDYEDDDDDDETLKELLFKQLLHLRNKKKKQQQHGKTNFVTFLKKYLNLNIEQRAQQLTDKHVFDFMKLSKAIINKKIKMNVSESDLDVLKELVQPETRADERKIVLVEDFRLKVVFKKALNILEEYLNEGRSSAKKN